MGRVSCWSCKAVIEFPPGAKQVRCYQCQKVVATGPPPAQAAAAASLPPAPVRVSCYKCRSVIECPPGAQQVKCWKCQAVNGTGQPPSDSPRATLPVGAVVLLQSIASGKHLQLTVDDVDGNGGPGPKSQFVVERHGSGQGFIQLHSVSDPAIFIGVHGETGDLFPGRGGRWCAFNVIELGGNVVAFRSAQNPNAFIGVERDGTEKNALTVGTAPEGHFRVVVLKAPLPEFQAPQYHAPALKPPPSGRFHFAPPPGSYDVPGLGSGRPRGIEVPTGDPNNPTAMMSNCMGRKKALFIGINYFGSSAALRGCINDVKNIKAFVYERFGFSEANSVTLTDDQHDPQFKPTKQNILNAFRWLVTGAQPGDSLFLHYSGHGGSETDRDGDEVDGKDETIIPVDYKQAGQITDDVINATVVKAVPPGVRLTAIFDSCHSGSVMDLPFSYKVDGNLQIQEIDNRKLAMQKGMEAAKYYMRGNTALAMAKGMEALGALFSGGKGKNEGAREKTMQEKGTNADVIQFSGCRDEQTSADATIGGQATGAMSWAFREAFSRNPNMTYTQLLGTLRGLLQGKYSQVPQMSSGHRMNMNIPFLM
eukprot:m.230983 g.230983  ORF g.230983 m.230983 type:complete len:592 (-) comp18863_c0_seq4:1165-2940(-)